MAFYVTKVNLQGALYSVHQSRYPDGRLALLLLEDKGDIFEVISRPDSGQEVLAEDETVVGDYAELDDMMRLLATADIIQFTGRRVPGSELPICQLVANLPITNLPSEHP